MLMLEIEITTPINNLTKLVCWQNLLRSFNNIRATLILQYQATRWDRDPIRITMETRRVTGEEAIKCSSVRYRATFRPKSSIDVSPTRHAAAFICMFPLMICLFH